MNEVFLLKAKLADKKKSLDSLKTKAENYIILLREMIDPYIDDFTELELQRASITLADFVALQKEARTLKEQIARMEKDLNG